MPAATEHERCPRLCSHLLDFDGSNQDSYARPASETVHHLSQESVLPAPGLGAYASPWSSAPRLCAPSGFSSNRSFLTGSAYSTKPEPFRPLKYHRYF